MELEKIERIELGQRTAWVLRMSCALPLRGGGRPGGRRIRSTGVVSRGGTPSDGGGLRRPCRQGSRRAGASGSEGAAVSAGVCCSGRRSRTGLGVVAHDGDLHRGEVGGGGVFGL